jgi:hypothetical protein
MHQLGFQRHLRSQKTLRRKETFGQALVRGQETRAQQTPLVRGQETRAQQTPLVRGQENRTSAAADRPPRVDVAAHATRSIYRNHVKLNRELVR